MSRHLTVPSLVLLLLASLPAWGADACTDAYNNWNDSDAFRRCELKASTGDAEAEFGYGLLRWSGPPAKVDRQVALDWLRKSARQGHWLAQIFLGGVLQRPELEPSLQSRAEAYAWLVAARAPKSAAELRKHMSEVEIRDADRLAVEFSAKYPVKLPGTEK